MTVKQSKNLAARQASKISPNGVKFLLKQKRVKPELMKNILFESRNEQVLGLVINHFVGKAMSGDVKSKLFLNKLAFEKFNKNVFLRRRILNNFWLLAGEGDSFGLRGLFVGVKDSSPYNRGLALWGLGELAKRGDARVLPGLIFGVKDSDETNHGLALEGLRELANKGNKEAKKALEKYGKKK